MARTDSDRGRHTLPISKLRGVPQTVRVKLKARRITNCGQLLDAAGPADRRRSLAETTGIDPETLLLLVQRADMARIHGIGAVFSMMLEDLGVRDVQSLAARDPRALHADLFEYNQAARLARRAPTDYEVEGWVEQARALDPLITYDNDPSRMMGEACRPEG